MDGGATNVAWNSLIDKFHTFHVVRARLSGDNRQKYPDLCLADFATWYVKTQMKKGSKAAADAEDVNARVMSPLRRRRKLPLPKTPSWCVAGTKTMRMMSSLSQHRPATHLTWPQGPPLSCRPRLATSRPQCDAGGTRRCCAAVGTSDLIRSNCPTTAGNS